MSKANTALKEENRRTPVIDRSHFIEAEYELKVWKATLRPGDTYEDALTSGYWAPIAHLLGADHEIKLRNTEGTLYAWLLVKFCDPARNFVEVVELLKKDLSVGGEIEPYTFGEIVGRWEGPVQKWVVRRAVDNIVLGKGIPSRAEVIRRMHTDYTPRLAS